MMSHGQQCFEAFMYALHVSPISIQQRDWNAIGEDKRAAWDHVARVKIANTPKEANRQ